MNNLATGQADIVNERHVIKVEPIDQYFSVDWRITKRCNYDCMYCSIDWHNNIDKTPTLKELQNYWKSIYEKTQHRKLKYKITFHGGEPSAVKAFKPFLTWLHKEYNTDIFQILVTTNGSASDRYYIEMFTYVSNITISLHSEHIDEEGFFKKVKKINNVLPKGKMLVVKIMNEFWNLHRIPEYESFLKANNILYFVSKINYSKQTRTIPILKGKSSNGVL